MPRHKIGVKCASARRRPPHARIATQPRVTLAHCVVWTCVPQMVCTSAGRRSRGHTSTHVRIPRTASELGSREWPAGTTQATERAEQRTVKCPCVLGSSSVPVVDVRAGQPCQLPARFARARSPCCLSLSSADVTCSDVCCRLDNRRVPRRRSVASRSIRTATPLRSLLSSGCQESSVGRPFTVADALAAE